jgi:hypothetical protein
MKRRTYLQVGILNRPQKGFGVGHTVDFSLEEALQNTQSLRKQHVAPTVFEAFERPIEK